MAVSEGWRTPNHKIDTEHVLMGLVREGEGLATGAIETLGVTLEQVRTQLLLVMVNKGGVAESLKTTIKNKSNVVTCRIDDQDMDAIDALVEVGIRSTRSDAASWLIHAGVEANREILENVSATVMEIRQLRSRAQEIAQKLVHDDK
jgi:ATP-dependent Clp protease ATP-binding subunit ClpA